MVADDHDLQVLDLIERLLRDLKEKVNHNYEVQTRKSKGSKKRKKKSKRMEYGISLLVSCAA